MAEGLTAELVGKTKAIFQWNITKDGQAAGTWTVDLKSGNGSIDTGPAKPKADCTLTVSDDDVVALATGKMDAMKAFMSGKLKVGGNVMLAQKLQAVLPAKAKL